MGCWSFYATKNMTTGGQGGMITTNSKSLYEEARMIREHGGANYSQVLGCNARMNTINAAIGRVQLQYLNQWNTYRQTLAQQYQQELQNLDVQLPLLNPDRVFHLYVIRTKHRDRIREELRKHQIYCGIHYPEPLHLLKPFKQFNTRSHPVSEQHCKENLSLPLHPQIKTEEVQQVCNIIRKVIS